VDAPAKSPRRAPVNMSQPSGEAASSSDVPGGQVSDSAHLVRDGASPRHGVGCQSAIPVELEPTSTEEEDTESFPSDPAEIAADIVAELATPRPPFQKPQMDSAAEEEPCQADDAATDTKVLEMELHTRRLELELLDLRSQLEAAGNVVSHLTTSLGPGVDALALQHLDMLRNMLRVTESGACGTHIPNLNARNVQLAEQGVQTEQNLAWHSPDEPSTPTRSADCELEEMSKPAPFSPRDSLAASVSNAAHATAAEIQEPATLYPPKLPQCPRTLRQHVSSRGYHDDCATIRSPRSAALESARGASQLRGKKTGGMVTERALPRRRAPILGGC